MTRTKKEYHAAMRALFLCVLAVIGLVVAIAALAFLFQRRLLYFPVCTSEPAALFRAAQLGLVPWRAADGSIRGWRRPSETTPQARVLVFHGNAGSALDRSYYAEPLASRGVSVTIVEYPGYGTRPGSPSEKSLTAAAVEAVDALAAESNEPIWLVGESIGSGVAARAARMRPAVVRSLFLVTPFARLTDVARIHYSLLPAFFLRDRWAPEEDLAAFTGSVASAARYRLFDDISTANWPSHEIPSRIRVEHHPAPTTCPWRNDS